MQHRPHNTIRVVRAVRRRLVIGTGLTWAGRGLLVGCVGMLIGVGVAKLAGVERLPWMLIGAPAVAGGVIGAVAGSTRRGSLLAAAQLADRHLGLKDRLSNAISFGAAKHATAAMEIAVADGERVAGDVSARAVAPVRLGRVWAAWPTVVAATVGLGLLVPSRSVSGTASGLEVVTEAQRRAAAETVAAAATEARETIADIDDEATREQLDRFAEIERELIDGERDPTEAQAEAARALEDAADALEEQARDAEMADQALRSRLADAAEPSPEDSRLADALAEGDLEAARDAAADLMDQLDEMSPDERARLAEQLEALSEELQPESAPTELPPDPVDESLRDQGVNDTESLRDQTNPDEIREQLEDQGVPPETSERLAEEIAERNRREQAERQAEEDARELSDAARDAAKQLREEPSEQRSRSDEDQPESGEQGDEPPQSEDSQGDDRQGEPQQREQDQGDPTEGQRDQGEQRQGERTQEGQEQTQERRVEDRGGQEPEREQQEQQGEQREGGEESAEPGEGQEQRPAGQRGSDGEPGDGVSRLRRQLERMAERGRQADRQRGASQDLREQAERLLDQASPEDRRAIEEMAREMADQQNQAADPDQAPPRDWQTEPFDATSDEDEAGGPQRVVGEWLDPDAERPAEGGAAPPGGAVRDAVRGAERAIERRAVPRGREDLIRRVFERYRQRTGEQGEETTSGDG